MRLPSSQRSNHRVGAGGLPATSAVSSQSLPGIPPREANQGAPPSAQSNAPLLNSFGHVLGHGLMKLIMPPVWTNYSSILHRLSGGEGHLWRQAAPCPISQEQILSSLGKSRGSATIAPSQGEHSCLRRPAEIMFRTSMFLRHRPKLYQQLVMPSGIKVHMRRGCDFAHIHVHAPNACARPSTSRAALWGMMKALALALLGMESRATF
ncbi:hypothetical protein EDB81DRAFT_275896 [Dactylonectria macrodidyma]|uniref:Uncharacterized protein n=1 Tax=Dactylonectria macrodidyma TaxID=307937 RepID=A0A9P9FND1_9HYPO|nr:hypothetical protein EDB81DRAFT_275896 [Dactylonectria macrodidyma]